MIARAKRTDLGGQHLPTERVEDPHFEEHLKEGPYLVFDDAARPEYRNDPRVHFVSGHPVLRKAMECGPWAC